MVKRLIRNMRKKPKSTRDSIAFGSAALFAFMVFSVWAYNTPDRLATVTTDSTRSTTNEVAGNAGFSSLFSDLREQVASVVQSFETTASTEDLEITDEPASSSGSAGESSIQAVVDSISQPASQMGTSTIQNS